MASVSWRRPAESASAAESPDEDSKDGSCRSEGEGEGKGQDRNTEHLIHSELLTVAIGHRSAELESGQRTRRMFTCNRNRPDGRPRLSLRVPYRDVNLEMEHNSVMC